MYASQSIVSTPVTLFKSVRTKKGVSSTLGALFSAMRDESRKPVADALRAAKESDPVAYKSLKDKLPGFCLGTFTERKDTLCTEYAPILAFDVDAAGGGFLSLETLEKAKRCPFVLAAFLSASGQGVRILMRAGSTLETHKKYYAAGLKVLSEVLEIPTSKQLSAALKESGSTPAEVSELLKKNEHLDCSTSNVSRIWFFTYLGEEEFYLNEKAQVFELTKLEPTNNAPAVITTADKIKLCRDKVNSQAIPAGRNNYVYALACEFAKFGVTQPDALSECLSEAAPDFDAAEITKTVASAYQQKNIEYNDRQIAAYQRGGKQTSKPTNAKKPAAKGEHKSDQVIKEGKQPKFIEIRSYVNKTYDLRLNTIAHTVEARKKGEDTWSELNENDLMCELMELGFTGVETPLMMLIRSSFVPRYDPLKEYFANLPEWSEDEPDYIEQLAGFVVAKDQEWFNQQFKKMLVRAVACALEIIPFNKQCFVIKSAQNDGKSSFVRFLCPPQLRDYIIDHMDVDSKDGRLTLCQNFIINLDELQGLSRTEINKTKALFTTDKVKERLPYDRKPTTHTRRASFFASTNEDEFLIDHTGNVRWLVFDIDTIKHDNGGAEGYNQGVDIDKVYSQAYSLLKSGFAFNLTKEEITKSEANNKSYQVSSSESDLIPQYYTTADKDTEGATFVTATAVLDRLQSDRKTILNRNKIGRALTVLGFKKATKRINGKPLKGYWVLET